MIVLSDASVPINLARISQIDLLRAIYGEVLVPDAVWREVMAHTQAPLPAWLQVRSVANRALVIELNEGLDAGESEAIALAVETDADWLLIDERLGRKAAAQRGVKITGLLGVLVTAKHQCLIPEVAPLVTALRESGFWLSETVVREVLRAAGEL